MDFLRKLFTQTQRHLSGLTPSQRLAVGSSAAVVVLAMIWLANWAQAPVMVPLLDQPMKAEEVARIQQRLEAEGVEARIAGDVILVPADDRLSLLSRLGQSNALPSDISLGIEQLIKESSPWLSRYEQDKRWNFALGNQLAAVLSGFDGIESASVIIANMEKRGFGSNGVRPSASVSLAMGAGITLGDGLGRTIATFVARAVPGLDVSDVAVTDGTSGTVYSVPKNEPGFDSDELKVRRQKEQHFEEKIHDLLGNIPGLRVAVHAELDPHWEVINERIHGKPQPRSELSERVSSKRAIPGGGPGMNPNTSVNVGSGTPLEDSETSMTSTEYVSGVDETLKKIEQKAHGLKSLYASINVPRSYLALIWTQAHDGKEPTDDELDQADSVAQKELLKIRRAAMRPLAMIEQNEEARVEVNWFHDGAAMAMASGLMQAGGGGEGVMGMVRMYGSKAGLGALAVMSLFMMMLMVRKVGEGPILPGEEPPKHGVFRSGGRSKDKSQQPLDMLNAHAMPIGEASLGEELLEGREVDDQTVRMGQVIEQISEMVKEDPDASVQILQRWIDSEES